LAHEILGKTAFNLLRKVNRTQDFPVEKARFPVENRWRAHGKLMAICGKKSYCFKGCGKPVEFSTGFPQY
jgi:hypothetical protein